MIRAYENWTDEEWNKLNSTWALAVQLRDSGKCAEAIQAWESLLTWIPDHLQSGVHNELAGCYEMLGNLERAEWHCRKALEIEPKNSSYIGGYASFLYLHGDPALALTEYLKTLQAETAESRKDARKNVNVAIRELGRRLGLFEKGSRTHDGRSRRKGIERGTARLRRHLAC